MAKPDEADRKNPFLPLLSEVADALVPRLKTVLQESEDQARLRGPEVHQMTQAVTSLCLRGGKRLRPGLCAAGVLATNARASLTLSIEAGISLELLQAYFLIHDDWMDQDDERRGGPTAHIQLARAFGSRALGERGAILAGDHAVGLSQAHLARLPTTPARLKKALICFAEMQLAAVAGQQLDVIGKTTDPELVYELKTASYTVKGPLLLGAVLAGASSKVEKALAAYSLPAGVAFQLRDDLIGVFGASKKTGKPQGGDLKEGKNTPLAREGLLRLKGSERQAFKKVLGNRKATPVEVKRAIALLEKSGARACIEERISRLKEEALSSLRGTPLTTKGQNLLAGAVSALADRSY